MRPAFAPFKGNGPRRRCVSCGEIFVVELRRLDVLECEPEVCDYCDEWMRQNL